MSDEIIISTARICTARYAEGWNMCLWGPPKMKVICGSCTGQFSTRDYRAFNQGREDEDTVADCPYCGMWNKLGVQMA